MSLPPPDAVWSLPGQHLGWRVHLYHRIDSTNTLALSVEHDPTQDGLVLLAHEQTAGRGQYGRIWQAPPGSSVLLSVLLFPPPKLHRPPLLTAWGAVAVCETIRKLTGQQAHIKWPNDVLLRGKKVCGILIEQRTTGRADFPLATVLGLGLNLTQSAEFFAQADLPWAGSLQSLTGIVLHYEDVVKALLQELDEQYHALLQGDFQTLETLWQQGLDLTGKEVLAELAHQTYRGRVLDLSWEAVMLESETGELVQLTPEVIRHLQSLGPAAQARDE